MLRLGQSRLLNSISFRISVSCWLVTVLALGLYMAMNLPQQQRDLLDGLRSKAQGVSSSLQDVTAGAALSEDYSAVVEHCVQVLEGDDAIDYLVITRADGYSVIVQRESWRTETLDSFWHPATRSTIGEIAHVPLAGKRVYRYARPFDYSAIHWGWINVGLSTEAYDRSVGRVYQRSIVLAILTAGLSLLVSLFQARRLVRPIVKLRGVVHEIASGDLSARASIQSGDEVAELGSSFNAMADTIRDRNHILESVRFAGQLLLSAPDWTAVVNEVLRKIGQAAGVSRAYILENRSATDGVVSSVRYEWLAPGVASTREARHAFEWTGTRLEDWARRLTRGQEITAGSSDDDGSPLPGVDGSIRCLVMTPILVGNVWWGVLGFDQCTLEPGWGDAEKDSFQAVAGMLGAAIARQRAQDDLLEANNNLEARVLERTRELQEQVSARELANKQLAEAQQRLMELSRQAGMAEIATGVLHNVGNVLNSVNVSATIVANKIKESRVGNLIQVADMLHEHTSDLPAFLTTDPRGQRVAPYLIKLSRHLGDERQTMLRELDLLTGHIGHIKEIVSTQQSYAKVSGLIEIISLSDLIEDAIRIVEPSLNRHSIQVERDYQTQPQVAIDKHSVLQILLNLLRNAKQAIQDADQPDTVARLIRISIRGTQQDRIQVLVKDSGVGLPPENLTRIFAHGFTTRRDGHGFGLHSGANAARRMGGSLMAESAGPGQGATFILELPLKARSTSTPGAVGLAAERSRNGISGGPTESTQEERQHLCT